MWASQPKAHKAISPTLHTRLCETSAFLGHLSWWVLLCTTVRSRCQAKAQTFSSLIASRGVWVYSPISPTRADGEEGMAAGLHYSQSMAMTFFLGSRQGWRLHSRIFSQFGAVAIWKDGYEYKPQWGNFGFIFLLQELLQLKNSPSPPTGSSMFPRLSRECGQRSDLCSILLHSLSIWNENK